MPDDNEKIGFSIEILTETKQLDKLQKKLDTATSKIEKLQILAKHFNQVANAYNSQSKIAQNKGNQENYEKYSKLANKAKEIANSYTKAKEAIISFQKAERNIVNRERINDKGTTNKTATKSFKSLPQEYIDVVNDKNLFRTYNSVNKENEIQVTKIYKLIEKNAKTINTKIVKIVDDAVKSFETKTQQNQKVIDAGGVAIGVDNDSRQKIQIKTSKNDISDWISSKEYQSGETDIFGGKKNFIKIAPKEFISWAKDVFSASTDAPLFNIGKLDEQLDKAVGQSLGKTKFDKFLSRVKNIVVYRLVRIAMSAIANGVKEGFSLLATNNSVYKDVITNFQASATSLNVTFASLILPIATALSSVFSSLTSGLIEFSNSMAINEANLKGQTEYFKIDKEAIDEYAKSLQNANSSLTQLDKFATLSQKKPIIGKMETITDKDVKNAEKHSIALKTIKDVAQIIKNVFTTIGDILVWFTNLSNEWKLTIGVGIVGAIAAVLVALNPLKSIAFVLFGAFGLIVSIFNSDLPKAIKYTTGILIGLAAVAAFIAALLPGGKASVVAALALGGAVGSLTIAGLVKESSYENSANQIDTGTSSIANSSLSSYASGLESGQVSDVNTFEPQVTTSVGNVTLDGYTVGKYTAQSVFSFGRKNGKI